MPTGSTGRVDLCTTAGERDDSDLRLGIKSQRRRLAAPSRNAGHFTRHPQTTTLIYRCLTLIFLSLLVHTATAVATLELNVSPNPPRQCQSVTVTGEGGIPPYAYSVIIGDDQRTALGVSEDEMKYFVAVSESTFIAFQIVDAEGGVFQTGQVHVAAGSDDCLVDSSLSSTSSQKPHPTRTRPTQSLTSSHSTTPAASTFPPTTSSSDTTSSILPHAPTTSSSDIATQPASSASSTPLGTIMSSVGTSSSNSKPGIPADESSASMTMTRSSTDNSVTATQTSSYPPSTTPSISAQPIGSRSHNVGLIAALAAVGVVILLIALALLHRRYQRGRKLQRDNGETLADDVHEKTDLTSSHPPPLVQGTSLQRLSTTNPTNAQRGPPVDPTPRHSQLP
ncbi:hypothetical protein C8Q80DRAFT_448756 [Daedaleopsis nitida]|nr:hypothetical protein C8Q80DRAFT_448756 [Daedaleopsis nitida]